MNFPVSTKGFSKYDVMLEELRATKYTEQGIVENLRPLLPSKYQFHIYGPILFICTRIGEIGSALFAATKDVDEQDVTLTPEEAVELVERCHRLGLHSKKETERRKKLKTPFTIPTEEDTKAYITASGRKYLIMSQNTDFVHARCASSLKHKGGMMISRLDKLLLVCLYESPMSSSDAVDISMKIEKTVNELGI